MTMQPNNIESKMPASFLSRTALSILLISVLGLFLEMMLIRWISTEIRIFAYVQNVVLVVCFLGLGLGCFTSRQEINIRSTIYPLLFLSFIFAIPISRKGIGSLSECLSVMRDMPIFYRTVTSSSIESILLALLGLILSYIVMVLILDMFVPIGRILGRLLDTHPNIIEAYSINVLGSLLGTWLFVILSSLWAPPIAWCAVLALLFIYFIYESRSRFNYILLGLLLVFSLFASIDYNSIKTIWSPYQKLVLSKTDYAQSEVGAYRINVNNVKFQEIVDFDSPERSFKESWREITPKNLSQYDIPVLLHPNPKNMLVVGSGTGNDVAGGLRNGIKLLTAVEIDPAILSIGKQYHPQKPYDSPLVEIVQDDARSFFATSSDTYDIISFGLLDSHTSSIMTNTRLDEYVFTYESLKKAKSLLAKDGIIVLHSSAMEYFIADRIARTLRDLFQKEPVIFHVPPNSFGDGGTMFVAGENPSGVLAHIKRNAKLSDLIEGWQNKYPIKFDYSTPISTDDWPYLYLPYPKIPLLYFAFAAIMIILFIRSCKHWGVSSLFVNWNQSHWHFFFLGAAFMLLEVQNISKAAVVLGSTWEVNAVIVSAVLIMILLANFITAKMKRLNVIPVYIILLTVCITLYFVDIAQFAFMPYYQKAFIVGCLTTLPMIFSGIIFIKSFASVEEKDHALGANLFGALFGALLQTITFITGIKTLLLIVGGLYLLSFMTMKKLNTSHNLYSKN
jgi:hypothetical protein